MSVLKRQGEKVIPDFTEDEFISALETSLNRTFYYRHKNIEISRISQSDENKLGYDGVLTTIVPFYIQFKRSDFYTPRFKGRLLTERQKVDLPTEKGFYGFDLLKKKDGYGQHNIMYKLSQNAKAAYVAPMFYKKADLTKMKYSSDNDIITYFSDITIKNYGLEFQYDFSRILLFKETITIPPHYEVTDNEISHHYTYCREKRVGFHSEPINLEDSKSETLYYFIQDVFRRDSSSNGINFQIDSIFNLIRSFFEPKSAEFDNILEASINRVSITDKDIDLKLLKDNLSPLDKLLIIEDILFHYFNIRQFIKYENL